MLHKIYEKDMNKIPLCKSGHICNICNTGMRACLICMPDFLRAVGLRAYLFGKTQIPRVTANM